MTTKQTFELVADDPVAGIPYDVLMAWMVGLKEPLSGRGNKNQTVRVRVGFKGQIKKIMVSVSEAQSMGS